MATKAIKRCGKWNVRVQEFDEAGKRHYKSFTAPTKKEAEYLAAQYEYTKKPTQKAAPITVGEAISKYIAERTAILSPSTIRAYRANSKGNLAPLHPVRLCDLTNSHIQQTINAIAAKHSPKTVRNAYTLLTAALNEFHPDFHPDVNLPKRNYHEISVPQKDDVSKLLALCHGTKMESAILLAAGYGLRRGEICALTFADIDEENSTITVSKSMVRNADDGRYSIKPPKTYAGNRTISVSKNMIETLLRNKKDPVRVVPSAPDLLTEMFERLRKKAGVSCRFHDLRHYNASIMLAMHVPDKYAMQRLGQSTPGLIKTVYQHIMSDKEKEINETMNGEFDTLVK